MLPPGWSKLKDCANYVVHRVLAGLILREADPRGFVPLKVEYLRQVVPKHSERALRQILLNAGVLECDHHYIEGEKAMGYRIGPEFRVPAHRVECRDARVAERVAGIRRTMYRTDLKLPVHRHLHHWLTRLDIDADAACEIVRTDVELLRNAYIHLTAVHMIESGYVEFSYCNQGRVHTLITRLARELKSRAES